MIVRTNEDSVELSVLCDIIWYKSPFVKNIIQSTTIDETKKQFVHWYHQLQQDLLGKEGEGEAQSAPPAEDLRAQADEKFNKIRRLYKISILILLLIVVLTIVRWNWPKGGLHFGLAMFFKLGVLIFFDLVLIFF
jgi:hypothetical protein